MERIFYTEIEKPAVQTQFLYDFILSPLLRKYPTVTLDQLRDKNYKSKEKNEIFTKARRRLSWALRDGKVRVIKERTDKGYRTYAFYKLISLLWKDARYNVNNVRVQSKN